MNYIQVARSRGEKKKCISRLVGANVNNVGADHTIGLTRLQSQFLFLKNAEARRCLPHGRATQGWCCGPVLCGEDIHFHSI